ncbi:MAG: hypothetical protein M1831_003458 [Alyxoria varia]|nr:MAG: hypothetical protein M1831_003458 [Alyxoria varia]
MSVALTQVLPQPHLVTTGAGYVESDPSTKVIERETKLQGYQSYVVEQWACDRIHPTSVIIAYTGDSSHVVKVGILSVPADEESWSPKLRLFFRTLAQYHARKKETPLGTLLVTNLSGFPSSLTIIPVPDGNAKKHREVFYINENLKRLGCSGRVGISLSEPSVPALTKFQQLYRTSDKIDTPKAVIELVRLCQIALHLFGVLEVEYADGLLCDMTEKSLAEWWTHFGTYLYNLEPSDGILGPTTVAAVLGTLIGARNRLHAQGATTGKDAFDVDHTKSGIGYFQKSQRLRRSRRLDRKTLDRLHSVTAKQATTEGWAVPRAVKSTVAELSGKGGEMVMDVMGGRDKATLAEIETVDIGRFSQLVKGENAKWLWLGKARKQHTRDLFIEHPGQIISSQEDSKGQTKDVSGEYSADETSKEAEGDGPQGHLSNIPSEEEEEVGVQKGKRRLFKRARGHLKDAVGKRDHQHQKPKDFEPPSAMSPSGLSQESFASGEDFSSTKSPRKPADTSGDSRREDSTKDGQVKRRSRQAAHFFSQLTETPTETIASPRSSFERSESDEGASLNEDLSQTLTLESISGALGQDADLDESVAMDDRPAQNVGPLLRESRSFSKFQSDVYESRNDQFWPRNLSFSAAEDAVFGNLGVDEGALTESFDDENMSHSNVKHIFEQELILGAEARRMRALIASLGAQQATWVQSQLSSIEGLDDLVQRDSQQLTKLYESRAAEQTSLARDAKEVVAEESSRLHERAREIENLGAKLEYELGSLKSKVEDVEDAVVEFEKQVEYTEDRVEELVKSSEERERKINLQDGWLSWIRGVLGHKRDDARDTRNGAKTDAQMDEANTRT